MRGARSHLKEAPMFGMYKLNRRLCSLLGLVLAALLLSAAAVTAQGPVPQGPQTILGSGFTFQGQLKNGAAAYNGSCNMQFSLWDTQGTGSPPSGGSQVGSADPLPGVQVSTGLFTVLVNRTGLLGPSAFIGQERWLRVSVECGSDSSFTALSREVISA